jgi:hypothetical protein
MAHVRVGSISRPAPDILSGSKADVEPLPTIVRSNLNSGHHARGLRGPKSASYGLMHRSKQPAYSITSSARVISIGETLKPIALAALTLMTNSNLVGNWTGRSAGLAPFRI